MPVTNTFRSYNRIIFVLEVNHALPSNYIPISMAKDIAIKNFFVSFND